MFPSFRNLSVGPEYLPILQEYLVLLQSVDTTLSPSLKF